MGADRRIYLLTMPAIGQAAKTGDRTAVSGRTALRTLFEAGCRLLFKLYFGLIHRARVDGTENIPRTFERLIVISNHASLIDGILIWTYLKLPFKIIVDRRQAERILFRPFMRNRYTVPIDSMNPYALKEVVQWAKAGAPLLVFPEGRMTTTGSLMKFYEGTGFVALRTGAGVLPVYLKNTYGTFFAKKHPGRRFFAPVTITVGRLRPPISLDHLPRRMRKREATRILYRMLSEVYVEAHYRPSTLGREFVCRCRENRRKPLFADSSGSSVTYGKALIAAFVLGRRLALFEEANIGIMLPNLVVTALVFMGLQIFGKVAVFLNYSSGQAALRRAMDLADLNVVVTSRAFMERLRIEEDLFSGRRLVFVEDLKKAVAFRDRALALAESFLARGRGKADGDEHRTAVILFTSGSEGSPKGVCLSHENIITNVHQALSRIDVSAEDYFLNALPLFHGFGLTVGLIIPIFLGARSFLYVSPLHYRLVPEAAYGEGCTVLYGTTTFLSGYGRRADPYDFYSLRRVFAGGEPLTEAVFDLYAKKFGIRVMAGYGATECSPLISVNSALDHEYGTVGAVLPGMEWRLVAVPGIEDKEGRVGRLLVRGRNVMKGYLKSEEASLSGLADGGWYDTGDIVEITQGGALRIVGRLKRFAKIGGEMISLSAVEEALSEAFGDRMTVAVMSEADERRGERLIAVASSRSLDIKAVREALKARDFPDLAIPRDLLFMKDMPRLGSGKVDHVRLGELVRKQRAEGGE